VRLANRVPGALLALALGAAGVFLIVEVAADRVDHRTALVNWRPAYTWAARNTWTAGSIRVTAAILTLAGLVLLLVQLKPPRVSAYTRRGVAAAVRSAVTGVDGIRATSVKVTRRRIRIAATAAAPDRAAAQTLREPVTAAARQRLAALSLRHRAALSVRVLLRRR
jgi:hypothetical protein